MALLVIVAFAWHRMLQPVPVNDGDLRVDVPNPSPASNGFSILLQAANAQNLSKQDSKLLSDLSQGSNWNAVTATALLNSNATSLSLIRQAWMAPDFQVTNAFDTSPNVNHNYLGQWRDLARLVGLEAQLQYRSGNELAAMTNAFAIAEFGARIQRSKAPMLIHMVGVAIERSGWMSARQFASGSHLTVGHLRTLDKRFDQLPPVADSFASMLRGEYHYQAKMMDELASGGPNSPNPGQAPPAFLFHATRTKAEMADRFRLAIAATPLNYREALAKLPQTDTNLSVVRLYLSGNPVGKILNSLSAPTWAKNQSRKSQLIIERESTRTILALRAFHLQYGRQANSLSELVPEFLPSVPSDDFDGKPLRYLPELGVLYSVGEDLTDSGGQATTNRQKTGDRVFPLNF